MAKVLLINGSPFKMGCTYTSFYEAKKVFEEEGIETIWIDVPTDIVPCSVCGYCQKRYRGCIKEDFVNETYAKVMQCGGILVASPVYHAGPSGFLLSFLERLFYSFPDRRKLNLKAAAVISSSRLASSLASNATIEKFFSINGMTIITSAYDNDPDCFMPDEARKDNEAIRKAQNLARNMAYYLKMRELAEEKGLEEPVTVNHSNR